MSYDPTKLTFFDNAEQSKRRHGGGRRPVTYATKCPKCLRDVRPPNAAVEDWPGTVRAVRADGMCNTCHRGVPEKRGYEVRTWQSLSPEVQEERVRRARADYDAMVADRRARGIHPDGIVFPGDGIPVRDAASRRELFMERRRETHAQRSLEKRRAQTSEARKRKAQYPSRYKAKCPKGHDKAVILNPDGSLKRHRCYQCENDANAAARGTRSHAA